jgi:hypothetical protein
MCVLLGHSLVFFSSWNYFFCDLYFRQQLNIKYILEITYGILKYIEIIPHNFWNKVASQSEGGRIEEF